MVLHLHTTLVSYSAYPACCQNSKAIQANSTTQFFIEVGIVGEENCLNWSGEEEEEVSTFSIPSLQCPPGQVLWSQRSIIVCSSTHTHILHTNWQQPLYGIEALNSSYSSIFISLSQQFIQQKSILVALGMSGQKKYIQSIRMIILMNYKVCIGMGPSTCWLGAHMVLTRCTISGFGVQAHACTCSC